MWNKYYGQSHPVLLMAKYVDNTSCARLAFGWPLYGLRLALVRPLDGL